MVHRAVDEPLKFFSALNWSGFAALDLVTFPGLFRFTEDELKDYRVRKSVVEQNLPAIKKLAASLINKHHRWCDVAGEKRSR